MSCITRAAPSVIPKGQNTWKEINNAEKPVNSRTHHMSIPHHHERFRIAIYATAWAIFALVKDGGYAFLLCKGLEVSPGFARGEEVNSTTPLVVLGKLGSASSVRRPKCTDSCCNVEKEGIIAVDWAGILVNCSPKRARSCSISWNTLDMAQACESEK